MDKEAAGIVLSSEAIMKAPATKYSPYARAINDLIKDVLKYSAFNAYTKLLLTCCSDYKRPLTVVTFKLLT